MKNQKQEQTKSAENHATPIVPKLELRMAQKSDNRQEDLGWDNRDEDDIEITEESVEDA